MFITTPEKQKEIILLNDNIKNKHNEERNYVFSNEYINLVRKEKLKKYGLLKILKNRLDFIFNKEKRDIRKNRKKYPKYKNAHNNRDEVNYFTDERVVVYTCILGNYDSLIEPLIFPDNIDYYAITDFDIPSGSAWKRIDIDSFIEIRKFSNTLKNRYVKMNPHRIFADYKYSIYVDGNIKIYSDLTEHVNRISDYGFSHFKHSMRNSSYEEADTCKLLRKDNFKAIDDYVSKMKENNFPDKYGLLECCFIVREHNKRICKKIMEQWWEEFINNVKRDQIILPYVLYKNGIKVDDIATLGLNIEEDLSFEIVKHRGKE